MNTDSRPGLETLPTTYLRQDVKPDSVLKLPELHWDTSQLWKPSGLDRYSMEENASWFSMIYNLLHNLDELASMMSFELQHRSWLNAYLLAVGMNQIVEDYLHADPLRLGKIAKYLGKLPFPAGPILANSTLFISKAWIRLNGIKPLTRKIMNWRHKLVEIVNRLAMVVINHDIPDLATGDMLVANAESLLAFTQELPKSLRSEFIRLPSCFGSFDQQPEDLMRIVDEFSNHWPEHDMVLAVIGIRTSGSYLAPLYAAIFKAQGYKKVSVLTLRPDNPLTSEEQSALNKLVKENGLALICDDPPISGHTITKTAKILEQAGLPPRSIIPLLQLFGDPTSLPASLQKYPSVLMSWSNWSIHRRLSLEAVKELLSEHCAPPFQISELIRLPQHDGDRGRQHVRAIYRVKLLNTETKQIFTRSVHVKGVGLGYFGEHSLAVEDRLPGYSAQIIALQDGLFYQELTLPAQTLTLPMLTKDEKWIDLLARYVYERNRQLPARDDFSLQLKDRSAVWEIASNLLSKVFGNAWFIARMPIIDPYVKNLLRPAQPSIIDGDMGLDFWCVQENTGKPLVKIFQAERDFSHMDMFSYDPVYDLASLAAEIDSDEQTSLLRRSYEAISGDRISPERWMLYQLVHLWDQNRQGLETPDHTTHRMAKVTQRYFAEIYFKNLANNASGQLCALDVDGVLETNQLGFPSLSSSSARSLRALAMHGYRVILATGRSIDELKDRCEAYHLAGGVAEYGSVIYDHSSDQVLGLLTEDELGMLYKLRGRLSNTPGISVDQDYRFSVRAYRLDRYGNRRGLEDELITDVLEKSGVTDRVFAIHGDLQTDFIMTRINKGYGLIKWLAHFNPGSIQEFNCLGENKPIAFAVGDSRPDLPMLFLARLAFAPAHASQALKQSGIKITSRPYQQGLQQAVTSLLQHEPGTCPACQQDKLPSQTLFMQDLISAQENSAAGMLIQIFHLYMMNCLHTLSIQENGQVKLPKHVNRHQMSKDRNSHVSAQ